MQDWGQGVTFPPVFLPQFHSGSPRAALPLQVLLSGIRSRIYNDITASSHHQHSPLPSQIREFLPHFPQTTAAPRAGIPRQQGMTPKWISWDEEAPRSRTTRSPDKTGQVLRKYSQRNLRRKGLAAPTAQRKGSGQSGTHWKRRKMGHNSWDWGDDSKGEWEGKECPDP